MVSIKNLNGETVQEKTLNGLMTKLGLGGTRNSNAHLRHLKTMGYDLTTLTGVDFDINDLTTKTTKPRNQHSLIERIIKLSTTIDKKKIKELEEKILTFNFTVDDLPKLVKMQEELQQAKNPLPTLDNILEFITNEYNEYMQHIDELLEEQEQEQE